MLRYLSAGLLSLFVAASVLARGVAQTPPLQPASRIPAGSTRSVSGSLNAAAFSGAGNGDIHDRANAAMASCKAGNAQHPNGCNVHIGAAPVPYACWPVSTTLNVPISVNGSVAIYWDDGACEYFSGSGPAVNVGGGALPNIGVHLINPKLVGVLDSSHLDSPNTTSPGGIIVGHYEGVVIDNPNITNFQASPAQLSNGKAKAPRGACGICALGTDGLYVHSANLEGNWDNLALEVADGYGTNNGVYDFHGSGARHRNINAEGVGAGNVIHVAADPAGAGAEEVIGYFGQGFGNFLDVRYSEGGIGDDGGYTPPNGARGKYGLVVTGGELHIGNYQSGLTGMTSSILVDNGASVYVDFASDGDDRSGAFFDFGPNLGTGRPGYFHIAGFYAFTALGPGHNPKNLPCSAIVHESPYFNPRNSGGPITTTCAVMQVEPYWYSWVTNGFTAPDGFGIKFHKPAVGTLPAHNAVTTWGVNRGNEYGGAFDDGFEYLSMKRTGPDPIMNDRSGEVPSTRWVGANFLALSGRGAADGVAPLDARKKIPSANLPSSGQLLSFGAVGVNTGSSWCSGLTGTPNASANTAAPSNGTIGTPIPADHAFTVSDLSFSTPEEKSNNETLTVVLRDNDQPTSLTCSVSGRGGVGAINTCSKSGSYTVAAGHRGSWCVTSTGEAAIPHTFTGSAIGLLE